MKPLLLPSALAAELVAGFRRIRIERSAEAAHHHLLVVREGPWATFTLTDGRQALTYLWRVRAQPQTTLARLLDATRDEEEAGRCLVPLADLREVMLGLKDPARWTVHLQPGAVGRTMDACAVWSHPYATPPVETFPPVRPSIANLVPGWNHSELTRERADLSALAAACFAPVS